MKEKEKKKRVCEMNEVDVEGNSSQHVAPVAASWPPPWLAALSPADAALIDAGPAMSDRPHDRGWRLPSGTVLCSACHARPANAVPVVLTYAGSDPQWIDLPEDPVRPCDAQAPTHATEAPPGIAVTTPIIPQQQDSGEPQWL